MRAMVRTLVGLVLADDWASDPARMKLIQSEPALLLVNQVESDRAISEAADFIGDYLGVDRDSRRLRVFIAAVGGMMFHIANDIEDPRDGQLLDTLLEAIDLLEAGLPV
ncbi:putative TetR family transcriptional regulator [Gordonia otitidis NBRC 100426]|uniref:TetR family transcriptional regulator n=1 Tax=Gordonia otitidis (strain DSM 44809 / CCUG 52243 / JCM 12355 / NBRC 100426 / IFM 10032) TaxID=1108044 RepID=H5TUA3_GORO1|nr:putative TetR family transcriptional regulator [Gordonia otitidis NBRC 100426]